MNSDPELLKIDKIDDLRKLRYKTEKYDHEKILASPKIDKEDSKKKHKQLNGKKVIIVLGEISLGFSSTITSSTLSFLNPSAGVSYQAAQLF